MSESVISSWSAVSVLVVDDEPGMRAILKKALSKKFAQVDTAGSIEEAEELRKRCHFDLLIVDINLPGARGGLNGTKRSIPRLVVVMLSS